MDSRSPMGRVCRGPLLENYGYPPQELIDYLTADEYYVSVYPNIRNCFSGGPAIDVSPYCSPKSPKIQSAGGDLTSSATVFVTPTPGAKLAMKLTNVLPIQTTGLAVGVLVMPNSLPISSENAEPGQASAPSLGVVIAAQGSDPVPIPEGQAWPILSSSPEFGSPDKISPPEAGVGSTPPTNQPFVAIPEVQGSSLPSLPGEFTLRPGDFASVMSSITSIQPIQTIQLYHRSSI
ncbi:hypothetical protein BKA61DRAFT_653875 [Leptodontidium sp. MPI-SDFR-AT-0119]|nr:hypothetical protein BKA61DRAFT_653875 [Leptodontidium sp. MPI-SDFR-AT-0119]